MKFAQFALCTLLALCPFHALAQDKDDDLKPDDTEHIEMQDSVSSEVEAQFPKEAAEIRAFLNDHIAHANALDADAYLADLLLEKQKKIDLVKDYTSRALAMPGLKLELLAIEFAQIQPRAATIHTRQRSSYTNDQNERVIDDVIVSYRLMRDDKNAWKILFTERRRLSVQ